MLKEFKADLHIHTCLSPCADDEMSPKNIVEQAKIKKLDIIGICDHNSAENVTATRKNGERRDITVIGGIEVTSQEEVHILALFNCEKDLFGFQTVIYEKLSGFNDDRVFGKQLIVNENDEIVGINDRLLIGATSLPVNEIVQKIHDLKGLAVASHIDRERFSIIGQLGYIPEGLQLDALELSPHYARREKSLEDYEFPVVTFSDAHFPEDIGKSFTVFLMEKATIDEMKKALSGKDGRRIMLD